MTRFQSAFTAAAVALAGGLAPPMSLAATAKKPTAGVAPKSAAKPAAAKAAPPKRAAKTPPPAPTSSLSEAQLAMATQVQTGRADCEFNEFVLVQPHATAVGTFQVKYRSTTYTMVPEETSTGAVRLFDKKAGVVWLQIPVKSMLMDNRAGRRLIDACTQPGQRMAQAEADAKAAAVAQAASAAAFAASAPATVAAPAEAASAMAPASAASAAAAALLAAPQPETGAMAASASAMVAPANMPAAAESASSPASAAPPRKWFWQR